MTGVLRTPLTIGSMTVRNRLYRAPVLEGVGDGPDAGDKYAAHFVENARHGVGMIVQGSTCIAREGRTGPGMSCADTREKVMRFAPMVDAVHAAGAAIVLQLGHGGLYAIEAWQEPYASQRQGPLLAASKPPWPIRAAFRGVPVHALTTDEVRQLATTYGRAAAWGREAGYDAVQLGNANAKLLDQFLSPFYNRRTDEFGGSLDNRARVLRLIREEVARHAGADYPCLVKVPCEFGGLPGTKHIGFDDALRLATLFEEWGFDAVTPVEVGVFPDTILCRGGVPDGLWTNNGMKNRFEKTAPKRFRRAVVKAGAWYGGKRAPFEPVWNRELFRAVKQRVRIPVFAVGGIRTADEVNAILDAGDADVVGIGRPFYAEPDLAERILGGDATPRLCLNSNKCVSAQMLGMRGVCYNPAVTKKPSR
ncbi:MAG TPA: NADH:flavin oxidoreductase [Acidimicrobiales bacterium]|nr:NADH:flavin oxidoreductase [Acidimicrobiales bacterium]